MLYLAQVKNSFNKDSLDLQLIAYQQANLSWSICHPEIITLHNSNFLNEGVLVLVNVEENKDVVGDGEFTTFENVKNETTAE
jgi:hypothetical protein